jgi:hypothetical protein
MDLSSIFTDHGILGAIVVIQSAVIVYLFKAFVSEKDKRITGAERVRDSIGEALLNIQRSVNLIETKIRISKEAEK